MSAMVEANVEENEDDMLWMCSPCQSTGDELFNTEMDPEDAEVAGGDKLGRRCAQSRY